MRNWCPNCTLPEFDSLQISISDLYVRSVAIISKLRENKNSSTGRIDPSFKAWNDPNVQNIWLDMIWINFTKLHFELIIEHQHLFHKKINNFSKLNSLLFHNSTVFVIILLYKLIYEIYKYFKETTWIISVIQYAALNFWAGNKSSKYTFEENV